MSVYLLSVPRALALQLLVSVAPIWLAATLFTVAVSAIIILEVERGARARRAFDERDADLRAIMDHAPLAMFLKDREGRFRAVNRRFETWYGLTQTQLEGQIHLGNVSEPVLRRILDTDGEVIEHGHTTEYERTGSLARGDVENVLVTKYPVHDAAGRITGIAGFILDITARKRAEAALSESQDRVFQILRESEERFRALIEYSNDVLLVVRPDGTVSYRSPSAHDILGFEPTEILGRSLRDRIHPEDVPAFAGMLRTISTEPGRRATGNSRVKHENGSWRHIAWSARNASDVPGIEGIIINSRDVTEAVMLEEELLQAHKMEAVGQLAGGIAHDFNNVLSAIRGFAGFLQQDLPPGTPEAGFVDRIVSACERAKELVQQILAFSRQGAVERVASDLGPIVRETRDLLRGALPSSTRFDIASDGEGVIVDVNRAQISQILLNLCVNANDALNGEPGTVALDVARVDPDDGDHALFAEGSVALVEGGARLVGGTLDGVRSYARIRVTDSGSGMEADVLKRIFDPFFTTKGRGRGTGLGLAVVHNIVIAAGGASLVISTPGAGSTFAIYLPLATVEAEEQAAAAPPPRMAGRERILVVEDEIDISDMLTIGLDRLGYEVVAINDPLAAVEVLAEDPAAWDLVICDQVMPGLNGMGVLRRLRELRPSTPFILCTGYSQGVSEEAALAEGASAFVMKPVPIDALAAIIRPLLDRARSAAA